MSKIKTPAIAATVEDGSYRQIMKATSIFGGVQVLQIIIKIISSKAIAILLGPVGIGIVGLLHSTIGLISSLTNFGLRTSAVKDVAEAAGANDLTRVSTVITVLRRLVWLTGLLGALITFIFASWLSQLSFGNLEYTVAFRWLSITLLLNQLSSGQSIVLQGFRKLRLLAKSSVLGSFIGLLVTVPLYYYYGIEGIVPVIIITSITSLILTWFFSRKIQIQKVEVNVEKTIEEGKSMMIMGFMISLSGMLTVGASYLIRIYISNTGGIEQVGFYSAGFVIVETYVGMIFTAMGTDYFPRLSAVNKDNNKLRNTVSQQAILALLIITPIIILFLIFSPFAIELLYSKKFLPIEGMVSWAILGMFFRAISWAIGYTLFAKGDSKLFIKTAFGFNLVFLLNNVLGYSIMGLTGLGASFLFNYIIHLLVLLIITKNRYQFYFPRIFYRVFVFSLIFVTLGFAFTFIEQPILRYSLGMLLIIATIVFSFLELDKRLNLRELIYKHILKK